MKRSVRLMILLVLASGCAGKHWTKEGATEADFSRDSYACVRESTAREASFKFGFGGGYSDETTVSKESCTGPAWVVGVIGALKAASGSGHETSP